MKQKVIKDIENGNILPVYVLFGEEYYFIEKIKQALEHRARDKEEIITYDLRETAIQDVITDVETFPFFSEHKIIFAEYPVFLQAKPEKTAVTHEVDVLETYVNQPVDYSTLILIAPYEKLDARKKITKQLKKAAKMVECNPIKGGELQRFMKQITQQENIELTADTYAMLESEFQDNLYLLQKEIHKLALFAGEERVISKETAAQIISPTRQSNALQFVDAVLKRDLAQAISIYHELTKMKEEPIGLIALLAYQFRIIFQVKLLANKGYPLDKMRSELKVHPYVVKLAAERSKYFTVPMLSTMIDILTETDASIKRGKMDKHIAFEMLLYKLITLKNI